MCHWVRYWIGSFARHPMGLYGYHAVPEIQQTLPKGNTALQITQCSMLSPMQS